MNALVSARVHSRHSMALLALVGGTFLTGCTDPDTFVPIEEFAGPAGVIDGTLTYAGPPPCTQNGRIVGAAIVLAFDKNLLPPPEGLGSSAASLDVVPGEVLFSSIRDKLVFAPDDSLRCPDLATAAPITASATWTVAPLPAATYQIRGFYDRDGDFDPTFSISNLPTKDDVGGGAISNATEVLTKGEAPRFTEIDLGVFDSAQGKLVIPPTGSRVQGIGVTFAQTIALERPVFYPAEVLDEVGGNMDVKAVKIAADFEFANFPPAEKDFIRLKLTAGVPMDEIADAAVSPFFMPVQNPAATFFMTVEDANRDGVVDNKDSVPESTLVPSLYPLAVFSKLVKGQKLVSQTQPRVIIQGLTLYKSLLLTSTKLPTPDPADPSKFVVFKSFEPEVLVALRPAAICVDPNDISKKGVLVLSHQKAKSGDVILADEDIVKQGLQRQFGRPFDIAYGCLPEGTYAMNLVYPTGQAWTLPNEGGVCTHEEPQTTDGKRCAAGDLSRRRLLSQDALITVAPAADKAYCKSNPTPKICLAP